MKAKVSNLNKPTQAKMVKLGVSLVAVSGFISASAFATAHDVIGYIGIGCGIVGTFIVNIID